MRRRTGNTIIHSAGRFARGLRASALAAVLAASGVAAAGASPPQSDIRFADAGGHRVAYRVLGQGGPVIVLLSGLGADMSSFDGVAAALAQNATVIVYDRAGYGRSEPGSGARDAAAAEAELLAVLRAAGVQGRSFVLGHSLGGTFAEYFAARHPDLVAGLILEESRPADLGARCEAARVAMCAPTPAMMLLAPRGAQAETAALGQTMQQVAAAPDRPADLRVLVLTRHAPARAGRFEALWMQAQADLAARHHTVAIAAPAGGHDIHHDQPDWFVGAVRVFVQAGDAEPATLAHASNHQDAAR